MNGSARPMPALMVAANLALLALLVAFVVLGARPASADGIGVYPTDIHLKESMRGAEYYSTIGVINDAKAERSYHFRVDGEVGQWVSFVDPIDRTKVLDGLAVGPQSEGQVVLRLSVPQETANGEYRGTITVSTAMEADKSAGSGSNVNIGADIAVQIDVVGTQKIAGTLVEVVTSDTEVGLPLLIKATLKNTGNVQVKPEIVARILASPNVLAQGKVTEESVQANETKTLGIQLDTSRLTPGDYVAQVAVTFGGLDLGTTDMPFKALPRGSLTRQGVLDALVLMNEPAPGSVAKVNAIFRNTGQIDSRAVFVGEFFRNGVLINAITGVEKFVQKGDQSVLEIFLDVPGKGTYTLRGKVNFEGKESEAREVTFHVESEGSRVPVWVWIATGVGLAIIVGGTTAGARSRLRRKA